MKRALLYAVGIGVGAAVGIAIAKRLGPPAFGDKPRHGRPAPGASPGSSGGTMPERFSRIGEMIKHAVDEGRRVMKQTEEELARQVASPGDGPS